MVRGIGCRDACPGLELKASECLTDCGSQCPNNGLCHSGCCFEVTCGATLLMNDGLKKRRERIEGENEKTREPSVVTIAGSPPRSFSL